MSEPTNRQWWTDEQVYVTISHHGETISEGDPAEAIEWLLMTDEEVEAANSG